MRLTKNNGKLLLAFKLGILIMILVLSACASTGTTLQWKPVHVNALLKSPAGDQSFNVIRFSTFGPNFAEQLYGYFLYKDGIEVYEEEGIPFERIGKMSLNEVMADYRNVEKSHMYITGSNLIVQEYYREGAMAGYTAADINLEVTIWDITKGGGPPLLRVVYRDLRPEREIEHRDER
jgi:hypothetical protein